LRAPGVHVLFEALPDIGRNDRRVHCNCWGRAYVYV